MVAWFKRVLRFARTGQLRFKLGYAKVKLASRLFPPEKGRLPPMWLASTWAFPPLLNTNDRPHALLAIGGRLTPDSLLDAYYKGVYPVCESPVKWVAFNPRMVLFLEKTKIEKRFRRYTRTGRYRVTFDTAFEEIVQRAWAWLVPERIDVAVALHKRGQAHSVEVWNQKNELVGGVFGVDLGRVFSAESIFHRESNAGKWADMYLLCHLQHWGYELCDAQEYTAHMALLGFEEIPRRDYLNLLKKWSTPEVRLGPWKVDESLDVSSWDPAVPGSQVKSSCMDG